MNVKNKLLYKIRKKSIFEFDSHIVSKMYNGNFKLCAYKSCLSTKTELKILVKVALNDTSFHSVVEKRKYYIAPICNVHSNFNGLFEIENNSFIQPISKRKKIS